MYMFILNVTGIVFLYLFAFIKIKATESSLYLDDNLLESFEIYLSETREILPENQHEYDYEANEKNTGKTISWYFPENMFEVSHQIFSGILKKVLKKIIKGNNPSNYMSKFFLNDEILVDSLNLNLFFNDVNNNISTYIDIFINMVEENISSDEIQILVNWLTVLRNNEPDTLKHLKLILKEITNKTSLETDIFNVLISDFFYQKNNYKNLCNFDFLNSRLENMIEIQKAKFMNSRIETNFSENNEQKSIEEMSKITQPAQIYNEKETKSKTKFETVYNEMACRNLESIPENEEIKNFESLNRKINDYILEKNLNSNQILERKNFLVTMKIIHEMNATIANYFGDGIFDDTKLQLLYNEYVEDNNVCSEREKRYNVVKEDLMKIIETIKEIVDRNKKKEESEHVEKTNEENVFEDDKYEDDVFEEDIFEDNVLESDKYKENSMKNETQELIEKKDSNTETINSDSYKSFFNKILANEKEDSEVFAGKSNNFNEKEDIKEDIGKNNNSFKKEDSDSYRSFFNKIIANEMDDLEEYMRKNSNIDEKDDLEEYMRKNSNIDEKEDLEACAGKSSNIDEKEDSEEDIEKSNNSNEKEKCAGKSNNYIKKQNLKTCVGKNKYYNKKGDSSKSFHEKLLFFEKKVQK